MLLAGGAVAVRRTHAQDVHGKPIVEAAALADLPSAIGDGAGDAAHRPAGEAGSGQLRNEGGVPGSGEAGGVGPRAQAIRGLPAHADGTGGRGDAAAPRQRGDEGDLACGRPPVTPRADGNGREGGFGAHPPGWSTGRGL